MKINNKGRSVRFGYFTLFIFCAISACKSLDPAATPPLAQIPEAYSRVNVPVEIPVETLQNILNQRLPPVLFSDSDLDMSNGIIGNLTFSRNGLALIAAPDQDHLQVTVPIRVRGEVGLKPGGLRNLFQSKVPVDQTFAPVVLVNPQIHPDWSLGISDFEIIELGGQVSISVLGMELDLTQMIHQEIQKFATKNLTAKSDLVKLKPLVDQAWSQVGRPIQVDFQRRKMVFSIQPDSVKLSENFTPGENYQLNLGLSGKVNSHPVDAVPTRPFPLPKLSENHNDENLLQVLIPLRISYVEIDQLLRENFENQSIRVNKTTSFVPSSFRSQAYGERLGIWMDFRAEQQGKEDISGRLFLVGLPSYDPESQALIFDHVNFDIASESGKARMATALKKGKIIRQLEKKLRFEMGEVMAESLAGIQERLALETPYADLDVTDLAIIPAGFYPATTGLEIQLKATGKVEVTWK